MNKKKSSSILSKSKPLLSRKQFELFDKIRKQKEKIMKAEMVIDKICAPYLPNKTSMFHIIGFWTCTKSPFGYCAYRWTDTYKDNCIFCGKPNERK